MNCIKILTDEEFGLREIPFNNPRQRFSARGIVFNNELKLAILFKEKKNEYKLIGGGIKENEDIISTFKREALEESGCKIEIDDYLGTFEEWKSYDNFKQISYIYVAHVIEDTKHQKLTKKELGEGSKLLWCNIDDAMELIHDSENKLLPSEYESEMSLYHTRFIVRRDYEILKYYKSKYID